VRSPTLASFTAGALCMLVLGSGTAVAATGGKFILGHANSAAATSTLTNTKGTALSLKAPGTKAPLAVSNATKVTNLNADRVDGLSSESLARTAGRTGSIRASGVALDLDDDGQDDTFVAEADCPAGTKITGGGYSDFTSTGAVLQADTLDAPDQGYVVAVGVDETAGDSPDDVTATAICYNPTGAVAGASRQQATRPTVLGHLSPTARHAFAAKAAARSGATR
jgi:hypothetical protein